MQHFQKKSRIAASAARVFAFHEAPDAFARRELGRLFAYRHAVTRAACEITGATR